MDLKKTALGIELGSTRIKAVLIDENHIPVASGDYEWENQLVNGIWCRPFDFRIRRGEVNGFTGLLGSGRSESVRAIFGADRVTGGKVKVGGRDVRISNPHDAMKNGIGYLPEDRNNHGSARYPVGHHF